MPPTTSQLRAFAHLNAEKAALYRAILGAFTRAKARFALHLRPADIAAALGDGANGADLDAALAQLCDWGNLEAHPDTGEVATVEDFYRPRYLFQLTAQGEAAERALIAFHASLEQPGELQAAALGDILALVRELASAAPAEHPDDGRISRALLLLFARLEELTSRAQAFLRSLQRTIDLQGVSIEAFLAYKDRLIGHLERFIGELVVAGGEIASEVEKLEALGVERMLQAAARREAQDALETTDAALAAAIVRWRTRWEGVRAWFLPRDGAPSQAEVLRARARSAIPALLAAVANLHDQRLTRTDRSTEWRTLARWFAELDGDRDAHRLWRAATGLPSARHLVVDEHSLERWELEGTGAQSSWLEAPPLRISMRLRATGRYARRARSNQVVDRSREKAELARLAHLEAEQIERAQRRLADGRPLRLSQLAALDPVEFGLLLDVLGEALAQKVRPEDVAEATSSDGGLHITLAPLVGEPGALAALDVGGLGRFRGPDHLVTIRRLAPEREGGVP